MHMRISKYYPISGLGADTHNALPPSLPTVPPAPANPVPIPVNLYIVVNNCAMGSIFGKWSLTSVQTEGMGDILWGYDWGPLQGHVAVTPAFLTPTMAIKLMNSSTKYWLAAFNTKDQVDGGALQATGGEGAVAISLPAYMIICQNCQGIGAAEVGFVAPTDMCFQLVSVRWVGFGFGDFVGSYIGMLGDALAACVSSKLGGAIPGGERGLSAVALAAASTALGLGINAIGTFMGPEFQAIFGVGALGGGVEHETTRNISGALLSPLISWGAGKAAEGVGEGFGSTEGTGVAE